MTPAGAALAAGLLAAGLLVGTLLAGRRTRAAEAERARAEARSGDLARALSYVQEGVILLRPSSEVLYANAAALNLLGWSERGEGIQGVPLASVAPSPALAAALSQEDPGQTARRVVEVERPGSDRQVLELTLSPAGDERRLLVLRDLRAVEHLDRKRRDFVANASHELQTPIAAIIGILDLVDAVEGSERERLLERARRNAQTLATLTRDLLGLARAEDPDWKPAPKLLKLKALVQQVVQDRADEAAGKGLGLSHDVEPASLELLADPLAFATVLGNLLDNALTYTQEGAVRVVVRADPGLGAALEVRDTGPGIDPAILPRIFERFFRGDPARSRASGGSGLGLSIVRNLVRRMGGRIAVTSRPAGGSVFRVELPSNPARPLPGAGQAEFK